MSIEIPQHIQDLVDARAEIERLRDELVRLQYDRTASLQQIERLREAFNLREEDHREKTAEIEQLRWAKDAYWQCRATLKHLGDSYNESLAEIKRLQKALMSSCDEQRQLYREEANSPCEAAVENEILKDEIERLRSECLVQSECIETLENDIIYYKDLLKAAKVPDWITIRRYTTV